MQAIGNDGLWHDWADLSEEERQSWMDAMTEADRVWEARKRGEFQPTLRDNLLDYENRHRMDYW